MPRRFIILSLVLTFLATAGFASQISHADRLRMKHPYGLIGDDFGVLNEEDLAINTCRIEPSPFGKGHSASLYWRCFLVKDTTVGCLHISDEIESGEIDRRCEGTIEIKENGETNNYVYRRRIGLKDCRADMEEMKSVMMGQQYVCLSGQFVGYGDNDIPGNQDHRYKGWIFDKLKTKKGCVAYWGNAECSAKYWKKRGCKPVTAGG